MSHKDFERRTSDGRTKEVRLMPESYVETKEERAKADKWQQLAMLEAEIARMKANRK